MDRSPRLEMLVNTWLLRGNRLEITGVKTKDWMVSERLVKWSEFVASGRDPDVGPTVQCQHQQLDLQ